MTKPSRNTDLLLINAARKLLPKYGSSGLNIRMVATDAKVNLGMFHYHFKSKDEFLKKVLQEIYEEFFEEFNLESLTHGTPAENLRSALMMIGKFIRDNRKLITVLIKDAINGDNVVKDFFRANFTRHAKVLVGLIAEAQNDGSLPKIPLPNLIVPMMAAVVGPIILAELASKVEKNLIINNIVIKTVGEMLLSDEAISQRVDILFAGLSNYGR